MHERRAEREGTHRRGEVAAGTLERGGMAHVRQRERRGARQVEGKGAANLFLAGFDLLVKFMCPDERN